MKPIRVRLRDRLGASVLAATALTCAAAVPWSDSRALATPPAIDFHVVSAGGNALQNSCFHLSGTVGQVAPGYSSSGQYALIAGFWPAAPTTGVDEIFFNGLEAC